MKIIVIVRTLNEERRIAEFCESYYAADGILIADGGSSDQTKNIAKLYHNVEIKDYPKQIQLLNGYWRNPDSDHANFLIDWAKDYAPDWIIYDDCDCRPNYLLKEKYREILKLLSHTNIDYVMATRIYLWGTEQHFPHMAKPDANHVNWEPSLWAWRGNQDFWTVDVPPAYTFRIGDMPVKDLHFDAKTIDLLPPYCLLHYSWDDPKRVEEKVKYYRESGFILAQQHPLNFAGPLEPLPEWAHE